MTCLQSDRTCFSAIYKVEHINTANFVTWKSASISYGYSKRIMLYNSGKHELAKPRKLSFGEIRDIAQKEFNELYPYVCGL